MPTERSAVAEVRFEQTHDHRVLLAVLGGEVAEPVRVAHVRGERVVHPVVEADLRGPLGDVLVHLLGLRRRPALRAHEQLVRVHLLALRQLGREQVRVVAHVDPVGVRELGDRLGEEGVAHVAERAHHVAPHVDDEAVGGDLEHLVGHQSQFPSRSQLTKAMPPPSMVKGLAGAGTA